MTGGTAAETGKGLSPKNLGDFVSARGDSARATVSDQIQPKRNRVLRELEWRRFRHVVVWMAPRAKARVRTLHRRGLKRRDILTSDFVFFYCRP